MHKPADPARWDDLRVFLAVMRQGSFSAAAVSLAIEQSTVSRRIAQLEADLRTTLFDRLASGPRPTDVALTLREHAERVEAEVHAFSDIAAGHGRSIEGRVRLALTESFAVQVIIPLALAELRALHPKLAIDLVTGDLAADLGRREADLAVRFFRPSQGDLVAKRIACMPMVVLANRSYSRRRRRKPSELDWVTLDLPGVVTPDTAFVSAHVNGEPSLRTNSHLAQVEAVRAGLGVALLARGLRRLYPELIELDLGLPKTPTLEVWLVAPRTLRSVPRVSAVWEFLESRLLQLDE